jgi:hypothetical protein
MKKYTNILFALGVTLFLLTLGMKSEAEAQSMCDSTWTQKKDTLTIAGCEYEYCVELPSMNVRLTEISHTNIGGDIIDCTLEGYQVELPVLPLESSECFILHTPCD